jgi:hypothetical protein
MIYAFKMIRDTLIAAQDNDSRLKMRVNRVMGIMPTLISDGEKAKAFQESEIKRINEEADAKQEKLKAEWDSGCNISPDRKEKAAIYLACKAGQVFDKWSQENSIERFRKEDLAVA